jgi:putative lipoic acid-binding regulatory protein
VRDDDLHRGLRAVGATARPVTTSVSATATLCIGTRAAGDETDAEGRTCERAKESDAGHGEPPYAMLRPMADSPQRAPSRELLLANHDFPGEYVVKAFGPASERFRLHVRAVAAAIFGEERAQVLERTSSKGARVCITLQVNARSVDEVIDAYERLHESPDLLLLL